MSANDPYWSPLSLSDYSIQLVGQSIPNKKRPSGGRIYRWGAANMRVTSGKTDRRSWLTNG